MTDEHLGKLIKTPVVDIINTVNDSRIVNVTNDVAASFPLVVVGDFVNGLSVCVDCMNQDCIANNSDYSLDDLLKYELSAQPTALFDKHGLLRQANKPQLADALPSTSSNEVQQTRDSKPVYNVLDGGSLLHRFPWKRGETFDSIASTYVKYVNTFANPIVVFDGYETDSSTKYLTHLRRSKGAVGPQVFFTGSMALKSKKEHFLANVENK
ncbi:hypothetical protein BSL78_27395 [Apostichopus japonicus]|uniref:Uncharacterized protein n=1 Tax=Stichopus japonicus TaxID=307972 RepID=A0A2G8JJ51_STIJA|nr:hypothetical protein BSL78_27395 [Apostichopus japonicus]